MPGPGLQSGHKVDGSITTADATLSALALSGVTLDPTFVSSTETYTATVVNGVTETTVTATPTQSGATVAFKDGDDNALTNPVTLAVGATVIKAVVTAPNGTTTKTYMVTVARAPAIVTNGVEVTSTPATGDTYGRGETIEITVTFDNAVTVDTSGGRPRIAFHLDGGLRWAVYSSGSGDTALVFTYTVLADDRAVNGILLRGDQFDLFGGTIRAAADPTVNATLTYADPGLQSGHKVDGSLTTNTPGVTVSTAALTVTEADTTGDTYTMVLNTQPTANVTVTVAGHAGTDVTPTPTSLTFTTSNWTTAQTVTVTAGDDANRANETVLLTHDAASIDANYHDITISGVTVTVNDNDAGVLVSNLEQSNGRHGDLLNFDQAQAFTTGSNSAGYTLTSIEIEMFWNATPAASFTVSIHSDNSGAPGASLGTLTHPSPLVDNAVNAFTHTGIDLDATTTYFVVVDATGASGGSIRNAGSTAEDLTSAAGWSIGDSSLYRNRTSSGVWATSQEPKKIRINGTVNDGATIGGGGGGGSGGSSGPSQTVPGAPTNLMAVATDGQVTLTWDAPEDDGGSAITDYEYRIDQTGEWISIGSTDTTHTVAGLVNGTEYVFEVRAVTEIGPGPASDPAEATPRAVVALDFAHFANGADIISSLVLMNAATHPIRPALYFYDKEGDRIDPESVVDVLGDLEVREDGALSVQRAMKPLGELTISTHGQGELVSGSVAVAANGLFGGVLRFDLPEIGVAGVGSGQPVRDAIFPARRQAGGISTAAALHNLGEEAMEVSCQLMKDGIVLEEVEIYLAANGQEARYIEELFPGADVSDFVGSVRCIAPGLFTGLAVEIDEGNRIFTTLPVVPVARAGGGGQETVLDFAHFANGNGTTSDLVFVNVSTRPSGPGLSPYHTRSSFRAGPPSIFTIRRVISLTRHRWWISREIWRSPGTEP